MRDLSAVRVMVVEDHQDTLDMLSLFLERWGYCVKLCRTGEEAIEAGPAFDPEIVLLDLGLPCADGYTVAEQLSQNARRPVMVALSGWGQASDVEHCKQAGFDLHLLKPIHPGVLHEILQQYESPQ